MRSYPAIGVYLRPFGFAAIAAMLAAEATIRADAEEAKPPPAPPPAYFAVTPADLQQLQGWALQTQGYIPTADGALVPAMDARTVRSWIQGVIAKGVVRPPEASKTEAAPEAAPKQP